MNFPTGIAADARGNIYIADQGNHRIRRVSPEGVITTFAGIGTAGFSGDGGPALQARLNFPYGVTVDARGNVIIADQGNHRIRRVEGTPGSSSPSADFDGNDFVDFDDFFLFAGAFGKKATGDNSNYDLDGSDEVDLNDFFLFADAFGKKV